MLPSMIESSQCSASARSVVTIRMLLLLLLFGVCTPYWVINLPVLGMPMIDSGCFLLGA